MSHIGKKPISIPDTVQVTLSGATLTITGPKGVNTYTVPHTVKVSVQQNEIVVSKLAKSIQANADYGTTRAIVNNLVLGVSTPWTKTLEVIGTGYCVDKQEDTLRLTIGFIHPVLVTIPKDITVETKDNKIVVSGINRHSVGQFAAKVYHCRKPDPYKGKGIRFEGQRLKLKPGKAAKAAGS